MNCDDFLSGLQESFEGPALPEAARAHAASCPACAALAARLRAAHEALSTEGALEWSPALTRGVAARLGRERGRERLSAAAAAAILVAVLAAGALLLPEVPGVPSLSDLFARASSAAAAAAPATALRLDLEGLLPFALAVPALIAALEGIRFLFTTHRRAEA